MQGEWCGRVGGSNKANLQVVIQCIMMQIKAQSQHIGESSISIFTHQQPLEQNLNASLTFLPHGAHLSPESLAAYFKNYRPRSPLIDIAQLSKSPNLKLKKYNGAAYYGEFVNGKRHGLGVMLYHKRIYEGEWQSDFKHGRGFELFDNQCVFNGTYINGKPEGLGRFQWPNGQFYEGEWLSGCRHGSGMWSGAKGDSYVGEWKFGKADGYGVHLWINGDRYEGEFKKCLKHGQGTEKFISGDLYKGAFYEGKPHGYGEYYWTDGSFYKGNFKNGFREGNGVWKKAGGNSDKYEGEYVRDKKQGYGIFCWASGNTYKGHYFEDQRDGYGEMFWNDGSYYRGEWRRGFQEGEGAFFTEVAGLQKGRFQQNELVELYDSIQDLNNVPSTSKKRKKNQHMTGSIAFSIKSREKTSSSKKQGLNEGSKVGRVDTYKVERAKVIHPEKMQTASRNNRSRYQTNFTSRYIKSSNMEIHQLTPIKEETKEHLLHSSLILKNLDQRWRGGSSHKNRTNKNQLVAQFRAQEMAKIERKRPTLKYASTIL